MPLSLQQVEHIAELAKLALTDEEKERYRLQLSAILEYADMLQRLDLDGVPPMSHAVALTNITRPDEPAASSPRDEILANAPDHKDGLIRVRPILE
ncbi:MAG: Asp-tRNA(Asn)/Glu-tRNA(Gln) amidotransferase subunit GatC [Anaerolineae bacterium]|nr:Asp-tRNA(Asn)/Glu-tRNA(Gln) amidotransferase subunit GatC [Anaerolineae bacterium]